MKASMKWAFVLGFLEFATSFGGYSLTGKTLRVLTIAENP